MTRKPGCNENETFKIKLLFQGDIFGFCYFGFIEKLFKFLNYLAIIMHANVFHCIKGDIKYKFKTFRFLAVVESVSVIIC